VFIVMSPVLLTSIGHTDKNATSSLEPGVAPPGSLRSQRALGPFADVSVSSLPKTSSRNLITARSVSPGSLATRESDQPHLYFTRPFPHVASAADKILLILNSRRYVSGPGRAMIGSPFFGDLALSALTSQSVVNA
jgi:hypothetical protein